LSKITFEIRKAPVKSDESDGEFLSGNSITHKGGPAMNNLCSIFSQLLQLFPRVEFQHMVKDTRAERHAKGFTCWSQFVAMRFCQLQMEEGERWCKSK
jgi:Domain of unknown function (DUF4372)